MPKHTDLRILSGQYKGKVVKTPDSALTHPMGAREKLALFNMLQPYLAGAVVLDAYAGTGALGLEALSRGARGAVFVEASGAIARILKANLDNVLPHDARTSATVYVCKVAEFTRMGNYQAYFDLILADPPYDRIDFAEIMQLRALLKPHGILVLSMPAAEPAPEMPGFSMLADRTYAAARLVLYQKS